MSESNNNIPMRITQLEEAETFDYDSYLAEAKAGSGTKKVKGSTLLAELINIRQGANSVTYPTAGDAVRGQYSELNNDIKHIVNDTNNTLTIPSFVQGTIGDDNGNNYSSDTNIRTNDFIELPFDSDYIVTCGYNYRFTVHTYTADKTYIGSSYWKFDKYVLENTSGDARFIRIKIVGRNMEAVLPTADTDISVYVDNKLSDKVETNHRDISGLSDLIRGDKLICEVGNGTVPNAGNTYCVKTNNYISCNAGDVVLFTTDKPLENDGDFYVYGYSVYDSSKEEILRVNLSNSSTKEYIVKIPQNGAYIRFSLGEQDSNNNHVTLRAVNFLEYHLVAYVQTSQEFINYLITSGIADDLPDYWLNYLETNVDSYNKQIADNVGFYGETFFFFTDVHWATNEKYSPSIIKWLKDNLSVDMVVQGGDILDRHDTRDLGLNVLRNYLSYTKELYPVNLVGNHDDNSNGQATETDKFIGASSFYRMLNAQTDFFVNWVSGKNYGYCDNEDQKIRYIYLDTGTPDLAIIDQDQLDWLSNIAGELDNTWNVIVFGHMFMSPEQASVATLQLNSNGWKVSEVLSPIALDQNKASIVAMICGHTHRDYSIVEPYNHLFPIICTTSDNGSKTTSFDPNSQYVANTVAAQAVDIFCINTENKTIKTIRVGNGSNRSWTYTN